MNVIKKVVSFSWKLLIAASSCSSFLSCILIGIKGLVKQGNKLIARVSFNGTRYSKNFKPNQIEQAKEWLVNTRNQLHGEFAHHGI